MLHGCARVTVLKRPLRKALHTPSTGLQKQSSSCERQPGSPSMALLLQQDGLQSRSRCNSSCAQGKNRS